MIVLASASESRRALLRAAGVAFQPELPRLDEESLKSALVADATAPRDIADALAEAKARKVSGRRPADLVVSCDQVLDLDGTLVSKPANPEQAREQIGALAGRSHRLHSAVVACEGGRPIWRHVGSVRLTMRSLTDRYIEDYVARNWESIRHAVGGYKLEEEGMRLFSAVDGDYFTVLGIPMLPLLSWLIQRGDLDA